MIFSLREIKKFPSGRIHASQVEQFLKSKMFESISKGFEVQRYELKLSFRYRERVMNIEESENVVYDSKRTCIKNPFGVTIIFDCKINSE